MSDTIFTKILNKQIPGEIVWLGNNCFSFMSIEPHNPGHLLVVPKEQIADWQDVPSGTWHEMMDAAQRLAKAIKQLYNPPKVGLSAVGFEVPHVHIHVFSLFSISDIDHDRAKPASPKELATEARKIRAVLNAETI